MHAADPVYIICDYVLGLVPLVAAAVLHHRCTSRALQVAREQCVQGVNGTDTDGSIPNFSPARAARQSFIQGHQSSSGSDLESASSSNSSNSHNETSNTPDVEVGQRDTGSRQEERDSKVKKLLASWRAQFGGHTDN